MWRMGRPESVDTPAMFEFSILTPSLLLSTGTAHLPFQTCWIERGSASNSITFESEDEKNMLVP